MAQRTGGKDTDPGRGDGDGGPLQSIELLAKREPAEQDIRQGVQIVTEAGRQDVPARHRVDIQQPIGADEERREDEQAERPGPGAGGAYLVPVARQGDQKREERNGPEDAVGYNVYRIDVRQRLEVHREDAPQGVSGKAEGETAARTVSVAASCRSFGAFGRIHFASA